jgi:tetratricopeptide (TPR) repeat protein
MQTVFRDSYERQMQRSSNMDELHVTTRKDMLPSNPFISSPRQTMASAANDFNVATRNTTVNYSPPSANDAPGVLQPQTEYHEKASLCDTRSLFSMAAKLGQSHLTAGNYEQALVAFGRALRYIHDYIMKETRETKEKFAYILFTIGSIHLMSACPDAARSIQALEFCLGFQCACHGWKHPSIAMIIRKLADVYASVDDSETALNILSEALANLLATGSKSRELADTWMAMGRQLSLLGRVEDAKDSFEESKAVLEALSRRTCTQ